MFSYLFSSMLCRFLGYLFLICLGVILSLSVFVPVFWIQIDLFDAGSNEVFFATTWTDLRNGYSIGLPDFLFR